VWEREQKGYGMVLQFMHRRYCFRVVFCSVQSIAAWAAATDRKTVSGIGEKSNEINSLAWQWLAELFQIRQIVVDFCANVLTR